MPDTYGYDISEKCARATIHAMFDVKPSFINTSRYYGLGRSEARLGALTRKRGASGRNHSGDQA